MQLAPNDSALRTPCQGTTGAGACQRRAATGGAANGMPLNAAIDGSLPGTPETSPPVTLTGCLTTPDSGAATSISTRNVECSRFIRTFR